jgi:predicted acylesterase/phospholipase RssA
MPLDFEYLALSGGGVKGVFSAGVLLALEHLGLLKNIKGVAGTSIGGLICVMYVTGYTGKEIATYACDTPFSEMLERIDPIRFMARGYISGGKWIKERLRQIIGARTQQPDITMEQLFARTGVHLVLCSVCREDGQLALMDHNTFPDLPVWRALRMTMALPWIFKPVPWKGKSYMDGGCRLNYPMNVFPIEKTLGIRIGIRGQASEMIPVKMDRSPGKKKSKNLFKDIMKTLLSMIDLLVFLLDTMTEEVETQMLKGQRFREIDGAVEDVSTLSFDISTEDKEKMVMAGVSRAIEYVLDPQWKTV